MRRIIVGLFVSLDGVMEAPEQWTFPYQNDEVMQALGANMARCDALLLGRKTYETYAASFAHQSGGLADYLNSQRKYVVSNTLKSAGWNNSQIISGDVASRIASIKQQPGQDITVTGSGDLIQTLMRHNLVDEYSLLIMPVVLGAGQRLFRDGSAAKLSLASARAFTNGVVQMIYTPAPV
jgi:dihydrofolate reductase